MDSVKRVKRVFVRCIINIMSIDIPKASSIQRAVVQALKSNGGSGRTKELAPMVYEILKCTDQQINYTYPNNPKRHVLFEKTATAQQRLKQKGIITLEAGVWRLVTHTVKDFTASKSQGNGGNTEKLLEHLQNNLDKQGRQLEIIIKKLLEIQGFKNVETTPVTNDGGIDIRAMKDDGWGGEEKLVIQVKNYGAGNKINNDVVASLRGRAAANHLCWIMTTSDFTQAAINEAKPADGKARMRLTNGLQLAKMLIESDIELKYVYPI